MRIGKFAKDEEIFCLDRRSAISDGQSKTMKGPFSTFSTITDDGSVLDDESIDKGDNEWKDHRMA